MTMNEASAIYEPVLPMGWIGTRPDDHRLVYEPGTPIPTDWKVPDVTRRLRCGIEITIERRGLAVYDFARWPPGVPRTPGTGFIRTFGKTSEAAKPALIQRLRVMNSHLTLLHAAAMHQHNESPTVVRVHERDLYRFDYPDEGGEGYWYRPFGDPLPTYVTVADRARFGGVMAIKTVQLSLDWLDQVVAACALIEFDLLNQTQTALHTHDYALAVVAGWTICELRTRAVGANVPGGSAQNASKVVRALVRHGNVSQDVGRRLDELRSRRNEWLHSGIEPGEPAALEAVRLGTEMLRDIVPDLKTRATPGLLTL